MNKEKQDRYDFAYLKLALEWANLSYCNRKKSWGVNCKR